MTLSKILGIEYNSHIIPFITGSNESAVLLSKKMQEEGFYVLPIRYPTVPKGKARLRFSLHAGLSVKDFKKIPEIVKLYAPDLAQ